MRVTAVALTAVALVLVALGLALPAQAGTYGPLRSTLTGDVVGMILVAPANGGLVRVRASASTINPNHASTAWIFCSNSGVSIGPADRLDGNIGSRTLEGFIDVGSFCATGNEVRIVIVDHDEPIEETLDGVDGSTIQVTTNNLTDPFCTDPVDPPTTCEVIASGIAALPSGVGDDDDD